MQSSQNLKYMNLESCQQLEEIPNLSGFRNLRDLNLDYCTSLVKIDDSVGLLEKLVELSLSGCQNLTTFPRRIDLKSVKNINFRGCRRLQTLPEIVGEMKSLTWLDLSGTAIEQLPSSIRYLINLLHLHLHGCKRLQEIPELPPKVELVNAADCVQLERFAKLSNMMEHKKSQMIKHITLFNCQRLCGSLVLDMAETENILPSQASLCSLFLSCRQSEFEVVFPGSEVPKWFSHSKDLKELTEESKFSFEIPPNFKLGNRGLAICAAAETVERIYDEEQSNCSFTARIDINAGSNVARCFNFEGKDMKSGHLWLCYIPFVTFAYRQSPPFTCRVGLEHKSQGSVHCKSYGVHLVMS